jgi:hypothetical protein
MAIAVPVVDGERHSRRLSQLNIRFTLDGVSYNAVLTRACQSWISSAESQPGRRGRCRLRLRGATRLKSIPIISIGPTNLR